MIAIRMHDGDTVTVHADPEDVKLEGSTLTIRRGDQIIGKFHRYVGWYETPDRIE